MPVTIKLIMVTYFYIFFTNCFVCNRQFKTEFILDSFNTTRSNSISQFLQSPNSYSLRNFPNCPTVSQSTMREVKYFRDQRGFQTNCLCLGHFNTFDQIWQLVDKLNSYLREQTRMKYYNSPMSPSSVVL